MKAKHHICPSEDDTVIVDVEDNSGRSRNMERYESGFHWNLKGNRWVLFSPSGTSAAQVFLATAYDGGHAWYAWDKAGENTHSGVGPTIEQAKVKAESAVLRSGKHFN